ncbi:phage tail protein [Clostridium sp. M14]|uniref:phage tail protein n=1 Tax=Clostridium sp. M14 TaxID=2716311 RepID=UPI0013EEE410|nr:phage tail protein [Clostridium sp. M14]MBZ9691633.1 phage tail protein [Clostridium sp. M14]NFI57380.1 hypothetical protein [Clostridium botulinum]
MSLGGFGDKIFEVSQDKIYTFSNVSNDLGLNIEEQEVDGDKPSIYIKGINNENPSFDLILNQSNTIDCDTEFKEWKDIMYSKIPHMLFLGNDPVSNNKFLLIGVSPYNYVYHPNGKLIKLTLTLTFKEYPRAGVKKENTTS